VTVARSTGSISILNFPAEEARRAVAELVPQLIVSDIAMPGENGECRGAYAVPVRYTVAFPTSTSPRWGRSVPDENDHYARVDAWMDRATKEASPERLLAAFERAFGAMWQRARVTLGDVTLTAILDRVLYNAAERFPQLSSLEVDATGLRSDKVRERAGSLHADQLEEGIRFILVEFLTVLGNLTAEVLTPALHSELAKATAGAAVPGEEAKS
jgi:hypothetical protein